MAFSPLLEELITALRCLPGVGPKSAQRMAFYLLQRGRNKALRLADSLQKAIASIGHCQRCNNFTENELCPICANHKRDGQQLCIVESPIDVVAIEQTSTFKGRYFVLMGHLSPLDGIGPDDIGISKLITLLDKSNIEEVILATNPTVEGEATAHFIAELTKQRRIKTSRIASGVPIGGELEFIDGGTLAHALAGREVLHAIEE